MPSTRFPEYAFWPTVKNSCLLCPFFSIVLGPVISPSLSRNLEGAVIGRDSDDHKDPADQVQRNGDSNAELPPFIDRDMGNRAHGDIGADGGQYEVRNSGSYLEGQYGGLGSQAQHHGHRADDGHNGDGDAGTGGDKEVDDTHNNRDGDGSHVGIHALQRGGEVVDDGVHDVAVFQHHLNGPGNADDDGDIGRALGALGKPVHDLIDLDAAYQSGQHAADYKYGGHLVQVPAQLAGAEDDDAKHTYQNYQNASLLSIELILVKILGEAEALGADALYEALVGVLLYAGGIEADNKSRDAGAAEPHGPAQALAGKGGQAHHGICGADD